MSTSDTPTVSTNVAIFDSAGKVLLTKRNDCGLWCLPGGMLEVGESITSCMKREVREEIGVEVDVDELVGVYSAPNLRLTPPARRHLIVICARAQITAGAPRTSAEVDEVGYFELGDLPAMVPNQTQRVNDAAREARVVLE